ncbi:hypothetical protein RHMOL_Rhmol04G0137200 [Rhododendron molle]|uniref:Uncharacterized protein n=1 Tax=Rhododendron molle TaxID=49168 RepID=A0ACC0P010_RHOML|nr:hypothetical protein RHMOL_Rhmol04G0137200 [Rhododendron molle]
MVQSYMFSRLELGSDLPDRSMTSRKWAVDLDAGFLVEGYRHRVLIPSNRLLATAGC